MDPKVLESHCFLITFSKIYDKKNYDQFVYEINGDQNLALIEDVRKLLIKVF